MFPAFYFKNKQKNEGGGEGDEKNMTREQNKKSGMIKIPKCHKLARRSNRHTWWNTSWRAARVHPTMRSARQSVYHCIS